LETLETQSLLDPADTSLDFIQRRDNMKPMKPIAIYRLNGEFLLNYSDFSFFVNRNGWRARPDWQIAWEGQPMSFALSPPYILAFEPSFIEIRHVDTGNLITIITGKNIRMLHESTREVNPYKIPSAARPALTFPRSFMRTKMMSPAMMWSLPWTSGIRWDRPYVSVPLFFGLVISTRRIFTFSFLSTTSTRVGWPPNDLPLHD
jgi:hypothetical protein